MGATQKTGEKPMKMITVEVCITNIDELIEKFKKVRYIGHYCFQCSKSGNCEEQKVKEQKYHRLFTPACKEFIKMEEEVNR